MRCSGEILSPTMQVCEGSFQQLSEAWGTRICRACLLFLEVWGLLVLQLKVRQFQHQHLRPHCFLARRSAFRKGPQVRYGEAKDQDSMGGQEGEGGAKFCSLDQRGGTQSVQISFREREREEKRVSELIHMATDRDTITISQGRRLSSF